MKLNEQQQSAVNMPLDTNFRVLAGPGSGKTTGVIVPRYLHLIENGIKPENILVVAFNKTMANELIVKIKKNAPGLSPLALRQICTINAFCSRELTNHWHQTGQRKRTIYKRENGGKNPGWLLDEFIEDAYGRHESPTKNEVMLYIDWFKFTGASKQISLSWFADKLGSWHGTKIDKIFNDYESAMIRQGSLDFADQLYLFERLLIEAIGFRMAMQSKFSHVLVDEAQDVSEQALRILITVSQPAGWNKVYEGRK